MADNTEDVRATSQFPAGDRQPARQPTHDVFVSYSSQDKPVADAIVSRLEEAGVRCWVAPRDVLPGTVWGEAIVQAIESTRLMVVVLSGQSNESHQVLREVERAVSHDVVVLPFRIESVELTGAMAYFLASEHWLDAMTPPMESHIAQLVDVVQRLLARPSTPIPAQRQPTATTPATRTGTLKQRRRRRIVILASAVVAVVGAAIALAIYLALPETTTPASPGPSTTPSASPPPQGTSSVMLSDSLRSSTNPWSEWNNRDCRSATRADGYHLTNLGRGFTCEANATWLNEVRDVTVEASVTLPQLNYGPNPLEAAGLWCRRSDTGDVAYGGWVYPDGWVELARYTRDKETVLANSQVSIDRTRPQTLRLECVNRGKTATLSLYLDGKRAVETTVEKPLPAGHVAMVSWSQDGTEFDPVFTDLLVVRSGP